MSYFMTVAGTLPENSSEVEFLPIGECQEYLQRLAPEIEREDGSPLFLVHDRSSLTSHELISEAEVHYGMTGSLEGSALHEILRQCTQCSTGLRIWWASDRPDDHLRVMACDSFENLIATIAKQVKSGRDIAVSWRRRSSTQIVAPEKP